VNHCVSLAEIREPRMIKREKHCPRVDMNRKALTKIHPASKFFEVNSVSNSNYPTPEESCSEIRGFTALALCSY
jgi:hypothetical protein